MVDDPKERSAKAPFVRDQFKHDVPKTLAQKLVAAKLLVVDDGGHSAAAPGPHEFQAHMITTHPPTSIKPVVII
jgi:hypothetical protein